MIVEQLKLPHQMISVNQPFGVNYFDFYQKLGLKGHNGIDFRIVRGYPVFAMHDGIVLSAGEDGTGGIGVYLQKNTTGEGYQSIYYHLLRCSVKGGDKIKAGQEIGLADNTGLYTTGDHSHIGFKFTKDGKTLNYNNGFKGAVDFSVYFPKNWDKSRCYHRYPTMSNPNGKERNWLAEYYLRFAPEGIDNVYTNSGRWIHRQLRARKLALTLSGEQINAIIYGSWDFESVINPSMYGNYAWLTREEYNNKKRPFLDIIN